MGKYHYYTLSGKKHTYYKIIYKYHRNLNEEILLIYNIFYKSLNPFDVESTISKVNNNEEVVLDNIFINAFNYSMNLAKKTKGVFDPTCSPLINLWGFGVEQKKEFSDNLIQEIKNYVGYSKIKIDNGLVVKKDIRMQLNFSGIGDGYSCEIIAQYFEELDVDNYMIDIGGEIVVKGKNEQGKNWSIAILKPPKDLANNTSTEFETILYFKNRMAIATSGNYNNYRMMNGKKYGHIINPLTGYPTDNTILGATVIASNCIIADAYATAIMAVKTDKLEELLQSDHSLEYYLIYLDQQNNYGIKLSNGMNDYIV